MPQKAREPMKRPVGNSAKTKPLGPRPGPSLAVRPKPSVTAKSVAKAQAAFKAFSLSKFAGGKLPPNHIAQGESPAAAHRSAIKQTLSLLSKEPAPIRAMKLALPDATLKKLLPSYDAKSKTIDLGQVITLLASNIRGTDIYANGNPTLNRFAAQRQVQEIMSAVKQGAKK